MNFAEAMSLAEEGFEVWAAKDYNKKWVRRIEGTPIRNDLIVNIATAFMNADQRRVPRCASCGTLMRRNCYLCDGIEAKDETEQRRKGPIIGDPAEPPDVP